MAEVIFRESIYDSRREFFEALLLRLPAGEPLAQGTARRLASHLRGHYGSRTHAQTALVEACCFWHILAERSGSPYALACYADALLSSEAERGAEALDALLEACSCDPLLFYEFAGDFYDVAELLGGDSRLDFQIAGLRAALAGEEDEVREMYSELLEEHSGDRDAAARVHAVGAEIEQAVAAGRLPRALVRRGAWRTQPKSS